MARATRLGHRVAWMARVVTPETKRRVLSVLENGWWGSVVALALREREWLFVVAPTLEEHYCGDDENGLPEGPASETISRISPTQGTSETTQARACALAWGDGGRYRIRTSRTAAGRSSLRTERWRAWRRPVPSCCWERSRAAERRDDYRTGASSQVTTRGGEEGAPVDRGTGRDSRGRWGGAWRSRSRSRRGQGKAGRRVRARCVFQPGLTPGPGTGRPGAQGLVQWELRPGRR